DAERKIEAHVPAGRDLDVLANLGLEARDLDFDNVGAARQGLQIEEAGRIRFGRSDKLPAGRFGCHDGTGHHATSLVVHIPADGAGDLGVRRGRAQDNQDERRRKRTPISWRRTEATVFGHWSHPLYSRVTLRTSSPGGLRGYLTFTAPSNGVVLCTGYCLRCSV